MKDCGSEFSKRVRYLRMRKGYSQEQLAKALGLKNRDSVSKIELGKQDVSTKQIEQLADILEVSISYLLYGQEDKDSVTLDDMDLLRAFWKAPPHIQKLIRQMLDISP